MNWQLELADSSATVELGRKIAAQIDAPLTIFLNGELGAGKTTLTRGIVQAMGHTGNVKSPTYTLLEPYQLGQWQINHFDLYRLADPEELEFIGIRDYFGPGQIAIIEWPEKGEGMIGEPDLVVILRYKGQSREVEFSAYSPAATRLLTQLIDSYS